MVLRIVSVVFLNPAPTWLILQSYLGLLIAGPIAAALAGVGAGGATGGLIGALVGAGIPEETVKRYEEGIKGGGIMMGVTPRTPEDASYFEEDWKKNRAENVYR